MEHPIVINSRGKLEKKDHQSIIAKYLSTQAGKRKLAQSMAAPIRRSLDYQGIARRAFKVEQLPPAAQVIYDKDIDVSAVVVDKGYLSARRVTVPEFEIVSSPTIKISDVKARRFNLIDRYGNHKKSIHRHGYKRITIW